MHTEHRQVGVSDVPPKCKPNQPSW